MMNNVPQLITFEWRGETLEVRPSHDLYMQIEERVSFGRLATMFSAAASSANADIPMSHVSWVVFCVLRHCGQRISSPMEVHQPLVANEIPWGHLIGSLISAYYGALPAKAVLPKKPKAPARRSSRR